MFTFGTMTPAGFQLLQGLERVYTYSDGKEARRDFGDAIRSRWHIYRVRTDLSSAELFEQGDQPGVTSADLTDAQKLVLYNSYPYKSLLAWKPLPEALIP